MSKLLPLICLSFFMFSPVAFSDEAKQGLTDAQIEQMGKLQEIQERQMRVIQGALPTISTTLSSFAVKLEAMKQDRYERVNKQSNELDKKVDYVISLVENKKTLIAKIKAMGIKWTPIGVRDIDTDKSAHYSEIRKQLLSMID